MSDVSTNFPFLNEDSATLTPGSFMGGVIESGLMGCVWRLRRWNFYGDITWHPHFEDGAGGPAINVFANPLGPGYILNGENDVSGEETDPFADWDDILCNWRKTRSRGGGENGVSAGVDIWWGPRGYYDPAGDPANGGGLDSEILFTFANGDNVYYLGTQFEREVGGQLLVNPADIDFNYTDPDGNVVAVGLYFDDSEIEEGVPTTDDWTGTLILKPGDLWWPVPINGEDTYDTGTGEQLLDPLRNDTNGKPLIYAWQAP